MKLNKNILKALPFLGMFILATGSVAVSCATAPDSGKSPREEKISVNAGPALDGKIRTTWIFDRIQSVILMDENDHSRKIELSSNEWAYIPETTELAINKKVPFASFIARVDGFRTNPETFILEGLTDTESLLVIMSDRLAIDGYDYTFDTGTKRLTFRNDVRLKDSDWSIQYDTNHGGVMLGEWKPESADRMSYLEAEHRKRRLEDWYDRQTAFWFLDVTKIDEWKANRDRPPELVRRAATSEELAKMKAEPVPVIKFRTGVKDAELSRELGFDARVPGKLGEKGVSEIGLFWKTIEETSRNGNLERKLDVMYGDETKNGLDQYAINITVEKTGTQEKADTEWLIDEKTLDLGLPVHIIHLWGTQTSGLDERPTVARFSAWTWSNGDVHFSATADSANDERTASLIQQFIEATRKGK
jgi:hypothetical protein